MPIEPALGINLLHKHPASDIIDIPNIYVNISGDTMTGSLLVGTDSLYDLGSSSKYWANTYTDVLYVQMSK
jgi:hypothetical protein